MLSDDKVLPITPWAWVNTLRLGRVPGSRTAVCQPGDGLDEPEDVRFRRPLRLGARSGDRLDRPSNAFYVGDSSGRVSRSFRFGL